MEENERIWTRSRPRAQMHPERVSAPIADRRRCIVSEDGRPGKIVKTPGVQLGASSCRGLDEAAERWDN